MTIIENILKKSIRELPSINGDMSISFKDVTPIFLNPQLCRAVTEAFVNYARRLKVDAICGIESRGFLFGPIIAQELDIPFILIRRAAKTSTNDQILSQTFNTVNGDEILEVFADDFKNRSKVLIHDDILATGDTASAVSELLKKKKCKIAGFSFIASLEALKGSKKIKKYSRNIFSLTTY